MCWRGLRRLEQDLLMRYAAYRVQGEWVALPPTEVLRLFWAEAVSPLLTQQAQLRAVKHRLEQRWLRVAAWYERDLSRARAIQRRIEERHRRLSTAVERGAARIRLVYGANRATTSFTSVDNSAD